MKHFKTIFALLILSVAFYSCDADATLDEANQAEFDSNISMDTGDQGNKVEQRTEEEDD
ncbi:hypothetical protein [Aureibaculum marinum]|uniref:hypothetical protein n=1 Tax=Aureibaculum marinum TaxID=2487930 RepID=UPI00139670D6|nr:hypothetical protein [Aureibaculum marinum]